MIAQLSSLETLPYEIIEYIFALSGNPNFAVSSKTIYSKLHSPKELSLSSVKLFCIAFASSGTHPIACRFFTPAFLTCVEDLQTLLWSHEALTADKLGRLALQLLHSRKRTDNEIKDLVFTVSDHLACLTSENVSQSTLNNEEYTHFWLNYALQHTNSELFEYLFSHGRLLSFQLLVDAILNLERKTGKSEGHLLCSSLLRCAAKAVSTGNQRFLEYLFSDNGGKLNRYIKKSKSRSRKLLKLSLKQGTKTSTTNFLLKHGCVPDMEMLSSLWLQK